MRAVVVGYGRRRGIAVASLGFLCRERLVSSRCIERIALTHALLLMGPVWLFAPPKRRRPEKKKDRESFLFGKGFDCAVLVLVGREDASSVRRRKASRRLVLVPSFSHVDAAEVWMVV